MPLAVKSLTDITEKWRRRVQGAGPDYQKGVATTTKDWAANTEAAEDSYNSGVQEAIAQGRFARGVREAGTGKWRRKIDSVGAQRWPQGVGAAGPDFEKGFAPYREALSNITLPPRMPRGHPDNINRVAAIASTLHELRTRMA